MAHRVSYIVHVGDIPEGLNICHNCNNPLCCNPRHLRADTQSENIRDQVRAGTHSKQKLTVEQVKVIRERAAAGEMLKTLATEYGIHPSGVSRLVNGKTFQSV